MSLQFGAPGPLFRGISSSALYRPCSFFASSAVRLIRLKLDALLNSINLGAVDLLASLLDGAEDGVVVKTLLGDDGRGLVLEGDGVGLNTYSYD